MATNITTEVAIVSHPSTPHYHHPAGQRSPESPPSPPAHLSGGLELGRSRCRAILLSCLRLRCCWSCRGWFGRLYRLYRLRQLARLVQGETRRLGRWRRLVVILETDLGRDVGQVRGERPAAGRGGGAGGRWRGGALCQRWLEQGSQN